MSEQQKQDSANATADLQTKQFANNKYVIPKSSGYYAQVAVAKPADSEGNVAMFICDRTVITENIKTVNLYIDLNLSV